MPVPYDEPANVVWQTRENSPVTDYSLALADALESIFGQGIHEIDAIVARLNETGPRPYRAEAWTPEVFEAEMVRLGC